MIREPVLRRDDYIKYIQSLHDGKPVERIPLEDMVDWWKRKGSLIRIGEIR